MRTLDNAVVSVETTATLRRLVIEASTGELFQVEMSFEKASQLVDALTVEPPVPAPAPAPIDPPTDPAPPALPVEQPDPPAEPAASSTPEPAPAAPETEQ